MKLLRFLCIVFLIAVLPVCATADWSKEESFELRQKIRYNGESYLKKGEDEKESKEALARKSTHYNVCQSVLFVVLAIGMIILILLAPKNKK